jgi:hypothetical protein
VAAGLEEAATRWLDLTGARAAGWPVRGGAGGVECSWRHRAVEDRRHGGPGADVDLTDDR